MAPFSRRSNSLKLKDHRRNHVGLIAVYGGFLFFTCFFLTILELGRHGYLTGGENEGEQSAKVPWLQSAAQEKNVTLKQLQIVVTPLEKRQLINGHSEDAAVDGNPANAQEGEPVEGEGEDPWHVMGAIEGNTHHEKWSGERTSSTEIVSRTALLSRDIAEDSDLLEATEIFLNNSGLRHGHPDDIEEEKSFGDDSPALTVSLDDKLSDSSLGRTQHLSSVLNDHTDLDSTDAEEKDVDEETTVDEETEEKAENDEVDEQTLNAIVSSTVGSKFNNDSTLDDEIETLDQSASEVSEDRTAEPGDANGEEEEIDGERDREDPEIGDGVYETLEKTSDTDDNSNENELELPVMIDTDLQHDATGSEAFQSNIDWNIPRAINRTWAPPKSCATAEEMGAATVGDTRAASLRIRSLIQRFILEHGAERVGSLPGHEFCRRGFVIGLAQEDGFGNNMYKVLSAASLAVMLNRSLIIGERGATNPKYVGGPRISVPAFGEYLEFSNQTFTMREVKRLWVVHGCATKYKRPLVMRTDFVGNKLRFTRCMCDDWTIMSQPIFHFKGATDTNFVQLLLKNAHPAMRAAAAKLLGNPSIPSSRPNTFGELFRAFISPNADIREAVDWALGGGRDPDIALHLRMLHSRAKPGPAAASTCVRRITHHISEHQLRRGRRPRVVVVTDTPAIISVLQHSLGQAVEVVRFNYVAFVKAAKSRSELISLQQGLPPRKRMRDWGEMPRWVAMVDFFLAARARTAVVSAGYKRVSTTYAQLVAALAAASSLEEDVAHPVCVYYSSFQTNLVASGLASQPSWGQTWRTFAGRYGCRNQPSQCARTALMPYAWWDAPWQSPNSGDVHQFGAFAGLGSSGQVSERQMDKFCAVARRRPIRIVKLQLPNPDPSTSDT